MHCIIKYLQNIKEKQSTSIYNVLKCWVLQCIYLNRAYPDTETIQIAELKQEIRTNPANQMSQYKTMKSQLAHCNAYTTTTTLSLANKLSSLNL